MKKGRKIMAMFLTFLLLLQQAGLAQVAAELDIAGHLTQMHRAFTVDRFRPLHLRYLNFNPQEGKFRLLLDKGNVPLLTQGNVKSTSKTLLEYFFIGLALPNDTFWVNLRPDSSNEIIDVFLGQTDVGRIMLETDLQLKKDVALATSPDTAEGKAYWDKLYQKAGEIFGNENVTIPTLTRPWIVPDEIIVRETGDSAYIYKATLKVMLEQDFLKGSVTYNFKDERQKALNEYSSQLIRELIIPKINREVNSSKRYASLRQVYYSLIMAQWFKARYKNIPTDYRQFIDSKDLTMLTSSKPWSKETYFKGYQESFKNGEYNMQVPGWTASGKVIRSFFSGGMTMNTAAATAAAAFPAQAGPGPALRGAGSEVVADAPAPAVVGEVKVDPRLPAVAPEAEPETKQPVAAKAKPAKRGLWTRASLYITSLLAALNIVAAPQSTPDTLTRDIEQRLKADPTSVKGAERFTLATKEAAAKKAANAQKVAQAKVDKKIAEISKKINALAEKQNKVGLSPRENRQLKSLQDEFLKLQGITSIPTPAGFDLTGDHTVKIVPPVIPDIEPGVAVPAPEPVISTDLSTSIQPAATPAPAATASAGTVVPPPISSTPDAVPTATPAPAPAPAPDAASVTPPIATPPTATPPTATPPTATPPTATPPAGTPPAGTPPAGTPPAAPDVVAAIAAAAQPHAGLPLPGRAADAAAAAAPPVAGPASTNAASATPPAVRPGTPPAVQPGTPPAGTNVVAAEADTNAVAGATGQGMNRVDRVLDRLEIIPILKYLVPAIVAVLGVFAAFRYLKNRGKQKELAKVQEDILYLADLKGGQEQTLVKIEQEIAAEEAKIKALDALVRPHKEAYDRSPGNEPVLKALVAVQDETRAPREAAEKQRADLQTRAAAMRDTIGATGKKLEDAQKRARELREALGLQKSTPAPEQPAAPAAGEEKPVEATSLAGDKTPGEVAPSTPAPEAVEAPAAQVDTKTLYQRFLDWLGFKGDKGSVTAAQIKEALNQVIADADQKLAELGEKAKTADKDLEQAKFRLGTLTGQRDQKNETIRQQEERVIKLTEKEELDRTSFTEQENSERAYLQTTLIPANTAARDALNQEIEALNNQIKGLEQLAADKQAVEQKKKEAQDALTRCQGLIDTAIKAQADLDKAQQEQAPVTAEGNKLKAKVEAGKTGVPELQRQVKEIDNQLVVIDRSLRSLRAAQRLLKRVDLKGKEAARGIKAQEAEETRLKDEKAELAAALKEFTDANTELTDPTKFPKRQQDAATAVDTANKKLQAAQAALQAAIALLEKRNESARNVVKKQKDLDVAQQEQAPVTAEGNKLKAKVEAGKTGVPELQRQGEEIDKQLAVIAKSLRNLRAAQRLLKREDLKGKEAARGIEAQEAEETRLKDEKAELAAALKEFTDANTELTDPTKFPKRQQDAADAVTAAEEALRIANEDLQKAEQDLLNIGKAAPSTTPPVSAAPAPGTPGGSAAGPAAPGSAAPAPAAGETPAATPRPTVLGTGTPAIDELRKTMRTNVALVRANNKVSVAAASTPVASAAPAPTAGPGTATGPGTGVGPGSPSTGQGADSLVTLFSDIEDLLGQPDSEPNRLMLTNQVGILQEYLQSANTDEARQEITDSADRLREVTANLSERGITLTLPAAVTVGSTSEQQPAAATPGGNPATGQPVGVGGIFFANLPIVTQAVSNLKAGLNPAVLSRLKAVDLSQEWEAIENLLQAEITPNGQRIKEYVQAMCLQGRADADFQKVVRCISNVYKYDEECSRASDPILRDILITVESAPSVSKLKTVLVG